MKRENMKKGIKYMDWCEAIEMGMKEVKDNSKKIGSKRHSL